MNGEQSMRDLRTTRIRSGDAGRPSFPLTKILSALSDRICAPLVTESAEKLAFAIRTLPHTLEFLLLVEDKRFCMHFGVDPVAAVRALIFNMRGCRLQGASTITQQIYKMRQSRTTNSSWNRSSLALKLRQAGWAMLFGMTNSKATLLTEYVDTVYLGKSYYGLDRAAMGYFSKTRSSLSCSQSFFLAERIANPNRVSPRRIANLLERKAILTILARHGESVADVVDTYDEIYGRGGEIWETLVR